MALSSAILHPKHFLIVSIIVLVGFSLSLSAAPTPGVVEDFQSKINEKVVIHGDDGKAYEFTTRDIILIAVAAILIFFILFCCIGYCLCECVKSLVCCIFCCNCD